MCNSPLGRGFSGSPSSNQNDRGWVVPAPQTGPRYNPPTLDLEPGGHTWEISDFHVLKGMVLQMQPTQGSPGHSPLRLTATLALGKPALVMPAPHIPADALLLIFPDPPGRVYYLFSHIALETVSPPLWHSMHCAVIFF